MPAQWHVELGHDVHQISNCSALYIEPMVRLDGLVQRYTRLDVWVLSVRYEALTFNRPVFLCVAKEHN
jgi:hypothetical protein